VEYESRRDADDAYHDVHNKRIGRDRDEVLKIEVSLFFPSHSPELTAAKVGPNPAVRLVALRVRPRPPPRRPRPLAPPPQQQPAPP
jgi:hypothetical protein